MNKRKRVDKKGVFFSTDALIALIVIFMSILVIYPILRFSAQEDFIQGDIVSVLASLKVGDINDPVFNSFKSSGDITSEDDDKSVLELIGEFYVKDIDIAKQLAEAVLSTVDESENVGIWFSSSLLASKNITPYGTAKNIQVKRQTISGLSADDGSVTGFSSRAFLVSGMQTKYFYFGGYVGDGNISVNVDYIGNLSEINLEVATNTNFSICINNNPCQGHFEPSVSEFEPKKFDLSAYTSEFSSGSNVIKFVPVNSNENLYIAGGYLKIIYSDSGIYEQSNRYYFPGIEGLINLYDGFYVPGDLSEMSLSLTLNTIKNATLIIGNKTIFNQPTSGEQTITMTNAEILAILGDYDNYEGKTIPLRLGLEGITYIPINNAYIFSVADISGGVASASADLDGDGSADITGVSAVQEANRRLVNSLLGVDIVQIGLAGTQEDVEPEHFHELSRDETSLNNIIDEWKQGSLLDLCEGLQVAANNINAVASGNDFKSIVLLGTKYPNSCLDGGAVDTYNFACSIWDDYGIRIDTVGIIGNGDSSLDGLLRNISECANGNYYNQTDDDDLLSLYQNLGNELIQIIYYEQTAGTGSVGFSSYLSPDSYIEFNYTQPTIPYGLVTTIEKDFDDAYFGSFFIPSNASLIETKAISYSGSRWTDIVKINNSIVYDIRDYGQNYIKLGDPYAFNIPNSFVELDEVVNVVNITTGISPDNSSSGSEYNKIIYTLVRNISSYSPIVAFADGCYWNLQFEDDTTLNVLIPSDYLGGEQCYYNASEHTKADSLPDENDAVQIAVFELLELLDIDQNGKLDIKFTEQDLEIDFSQIVGIPFDWDTEAQVRKWS